MDRTERFYKIDQLLGERRIVPFSVFAEKLGVSRATIKRDLEYLRSRLNAPIVWDREQGGYRFTEPERGAGQYELPGLWFNASEIHALLTMQHLLMNLDAGGLLGPHIQPLLVRLGALLGTGSDASEEIHKRIRIIGMAARRMALDHFAVVGSALLDRKCLLLSYYVRSRDEVTEREVSPQRLVHYRENWYLDGWCHVRNELRSFSVDAIRRAEILELPARNVAEKTLDAILGAGYGIFSGRTVEWARLRFTPQRARWVANEQWHPRQKGAFDADGSYVLELPYSDHRELAMDILRFGADVEVIAPATLRNKVVAEMKAALRRYEDGEEEKS
ncbi:MAG: DNA-binding protein [Rhodocyclales bacterium GWA2_65_20]|nr:MAG: DNA-binding protein [Rhodocyclales bacterium GWA2_65_20]